jgi:putative phosphoribosyl transferase
MRQLNDEGQMVDRFQDRKEAGRVLAESLREFANDRSVLVLALPRGGVPVGYEIARDLGLPLDVFIVRKLGVPGYEELAMGAIASGGVRVLNEDVVNRIGISAQQLDAVAAREQQEIERREYEYRGDLPALNVHDRKIILVDDGLATGATMRAAVQALREAGASEIIVAIPVGSIEAVQRIGGEADRVFCPLQPENFAAVGQFYDDFSQTSDEEVRELLAESMHVQT